MIFNSAQHTQVINGREKQTFNYKKWRFRLCRAGRHIALTDQVLFEYKLNKPLFKLMKNNMQNLYLVVLK